jgi:hypothetical protein
MTSIFLPSLQSFANACGLIEVMVMVIFFRYSKLGS